jgi:eukaryotic-like serine/threonine-protein kinase
MNKKYIVAAITAGATLVGCGWYLFKVSQRQAEEMQQQLHDALRLAQETKYDECTSLLQDTIEKMKSFYGPEHPTTIHTVAILAEILHRQNKLPEAEALMRACCLGLDQALGCDHEESLGCQTELMHILGDAGNTSEALATGRKLFDTLCEKFGPNDLQCVKVGSALCAFMKAEGELQPSVDFARILVESCRSGSPSAASSPESLRLALQVLTELLRDAGNTDEAICCAQELVAVCTANNLEADGPPQSHYLLLNLQLAVSIEDALLTARSAANFCEQQHGAQSHEHVESQLVLARLLSQSGAFQEALTTWERVFVVLAQSLGTEHHEILDMQVHTIPSYFQQTQVQLMRQVQMATCLLQMERHAEAEVLLQRVVAMHESLPDGKLSTTYLLAAHYLSLCVPNLVIFRALSPRPTHTSTVAEPFI